MPLQFVAQGPMQLPAASGYLGPGNLTFAAATPLAWWGLRAYSSTTGAVPCIDIVDVNDANPATISLLSNGSLNVVALSAAIAGYGANVPARITKLYDQIGTFPVLQTNTGSNRITIVIESGVPKMRAVGGYLESSVNSLTQTIPVSIYFAGNRDPTSSTTMYGIANTSNDRGVGFGGSNLAAFIAPFNTVAFSDTAIDVTHHVIQGIVNDPTSTMRVDGRADVTGAVTVASYNGPLGFMSDGGGARLNGVGLEGGVWGGTFSAPESAALYNQVKAYWNTLTWG